ncbi:MAG TPA: hypothetical protein VF268_00710, partial [Gammaproteobacteria bacterium]
AVIPATVNTAAYAMRIRLPWLFLFITRLQMEYKHFYRKSPRFELMHLKLKAAHGMKRVFAAG